MLKDFWWSSLRLIGRLFVGTSFMSTEFDLRNLSAPASGWMKVLLLIDVFLRPRSLDQSPFLARYLHSQNRLVSSYVAYVLPLPHVRHHLRSPADLVARPIAECRAVPHLCGSGSGSGSAHGERLRGAAAHSRFSLPQVRQSLGSPSFLFSLAHAPA